MRNLFIAMWLLSVLPVSAVVARLWRRYASPADYLGILFALCSAFIFTVATAATAFVFDAFVPGIFAALAVAVFIGSSAFFFMNKWGRGDFVAVVIYYTTMVASMVAFITQ